jgi:hypothetical protein
MSRLLTGYAVWFNKKYRRLRMSTIEIARKLRISQPAASRSSKRGEQIERKHRFELIPKKYKNIDVPNIPLLSEFGIFFRRIMRDTGIYKLKCVLIDGIKIRGCRVILIRRKIIF